jgi:hypothetical protein
MALTPRSVDEYHVFLASPGNTEQEREAVHQFFEAYNRHTARSWGERYVRAAKGRVR